jgi:urease accessory protein
MARAGLRVTGTITATIMATNMDSASLYRLMAWLSPSYPVGAFSYSHGIEWLVESGAIHDRESLAQWLGDLLVLGSGRNDAILFAAAFRTNGKIAALCRIADHANAFAASAERCLETQSQGQAFSDVTRRTWQSPTLDRLTALYPQPVPYPVAVGIAAADHGLELGLVLRAYVHAFAANLVSAGLRLIPLGHSDGQRVMQMLEHSVEETAVAGETKDISALASLTIMADIAAMKHETQYTRLFRS